MRAFQIQKKKDMLVWSTKNNGTSLIQYNYRSNYEIKAKTYEKMDEKGV